MQVSEGQHVLPGLQEEAGAPGQGVGQPLAAAEGDRLVVRLWRTLV